MVTVSFFKFPRNNRWYAFTQMGRAHESLSQVKGCSFYKLMGSGAGNGFNIWPDLSVFCLLMRWDSELEKSQFFQESTWWDEYKGKSTGHFTLDLVATKVKGEWGGSQPFSEEENAVQDGKVVILTRATIKKRFIPYFWSKVPKASAPVKDIPGHIFSKGVGEVPLLHQATVSVWESREAMRSYAYEHDAHMKMIKMTRQKGWYSEEMFTEFNLVNIEGEIW